MKKIVLYLLFMLMFAFSTAEEKPFEASYDECDFKETLEDYDLKAVRLTFDGEFQYEGFEAADLNPNLPLFRSDDVTWDVIAISKTDFAFLGLTPDDKKKNVLRIEKIYRTYGSNKDQMEENLPSENVFITKGQSFYEEPTNTFAVTETLSFDEKNTYVHRTSTDGLNCFNEKHCIYDPYQKKPVSVDVNILSYICGLQVYEKEKFKYYVKDANGNEVCISKEHDYQKVFVFPKNPTSVANGNCDLVSKQKAAYKAAHGKPGGGSGTDGNGKGGNVVVNGNSSANEKTCPKKWDWYIAAIPFGLFFVILIGGIVMVVIERKGKGKKQAYMRLQKMLKKDEPSAYTTMTQGQTQDDGRTETQTQDGGRTPDGVRTKTQDGGRTKTQDGGRTKTQDAGRTQTQDGGRTPDDNNKSTVKTVNSKRT